ncbi:uncharacterized mitochondrial protein AtMg00810-like [Rutidosis leptorrhynchoides]|uniref:uncharacterized mitochondrial protein AtMg00810-like n=1 Tax=Rutidosis leptorrhynchoides TaxID=125765 RepID=UPI003A999984
MGQPSILGPRPSHNFVDSVASSSTPMDIEAEMHTMSLNPPDENWYLDMGATSHVTDDIILATSSNTFRDLLMSNEFAMKNLGPLNSFLGISVTRTDEGLFLNQTSYAKEIILQGGLSHCNTVTTPVDTNGKQSATPRNLYSDPTYYQSLAGALPYLIFTRPNISYAVQQICLHMHAPHDAHMHALKHIIRYINGTSSLGLIISKSPSPNLVSYTDAEWAGCPDTRRSTSGYCAYLESCLIRNLLLELKCHIHKVTLVFCDNVIAIYLSGNPVQHQRTKHIELDIHFVREKVSKGQVRIMHVPTRFQLVDIFTKYLPRIL